METAHTIGSKYNQVKNLPIKEIAKLVRQDLKKFKDCKFSVTSTYNTINVKLSACNNLLKYFDVWEGYHQKDARYKDSFSKEVKSIMNQYNFDNSDIMSDYHHQNFFAFFNSPHIDLLNQAREVLNLPILKMNGEVA
tara:strand:- start:37 stop:447 length:411 start_codon:yes stop_codon:yes gene_type:complete